MAIRLVARSVACSAGSYTGQVMPAIRELRKFAHMLIWRIHSGAFSAARFETEMTKLRRCF
jgi:hypothetical protein